MKTTDILSPGLLSPKPAKHALRGAGHASDGGGFSKLVRPEEPAATARAPRGERIDASAVHIEAHNDRADMTQPEDSFAGHLERSTGPEAHHDRLTPDRERVGEESEIAAPDDGQRRHDEPDASNADAALPTRPQAAILMTPDLSPPQRHDGAKRSTDTPAAAKPDLPRAAPGTSNILDAEHKEPTTGAAAPLIGMSRSPIANAPVENRLKPTFAANAGRPSHRDGDRPPPSVGPATKSSTSEAIPISTDRVETRQADAEPVLAETHPIKAPTGSSQPIPDHHANQRAPSPDETVKSAARGPAMAATAPAAAAVAGSTPTPRGVAQADRSPATVQIRVPTGTSSPPPSPSPSKLPGSEEPPTQNGPAPTTAAVGAAPRTDDFPTKGPDAAARPHPAAATSARPAPALDEPISAELKPQTASTDIGSLAAADMPNSFRPTGPALPTATAVAAASAIAAAGKEARPILLVGQTSPNAADHQPDLPSYRPADAQMPARAAAQIVSTRSEPVATPTAVATVEPVGPATQTSVQPTAPTASAEEPAIPAQTAQPIQPGAAAAASGPPAPPVGTSPPSFAVELTAAAARYVNRQSARAEDTRPAARTFDGQGEVPAKAPLEGRTFAPPEPSRAPLPAMMWRALSPASATAAPDMERQALPDQGLEPPVSDTVPTMKGDDAEIDAKSPPEPSRATQPNVVTGPLKSVETAAQPASPPLTVASAILSEPTWRATPVAQTTQSQSVRAQPVLKSLQVQLNPEHLGVVTATLSVSGTQLTVELSVATREAHDRLKGEEQVIEKAVRSLGYDVGQVSIIQSLVVQNTHLRADATIPQAMAQGRDQPGGGMASGNGGNRSGSQQGGRHEGNASGAFGGTAARDADRRGGVYI